MTTPLYAWNRGPAPRIQHSNPEKAFTQVAQHHGCQLPPSHVLRQIIDAVLACADTIAQVSMAFPRQCWEDANWLAHERERMRHKLLDQIVSTGRIPTELPTETRRFTVGFHMGEGGRTVPDNAVMAGVEWDEVVLTLSVPVRTPPIDRGAAVKAGVVYRVESP